MSTVLLFIIVVFHTHAFRQLRNLRKEQHMVMSKMVGKENIWL